MDTVFKFLYEFLGQFFSSLWSIFVGIGKGIVGMFNFGEYGNIISDYTSELGGLEWVIAIFAMLVLATVLVFIVLFIVLSLKKFFRYRRKVKDTGDLVSEVNHLTKEVMRQNPINEG